MDKVNVQLRAARFARSQRLLVEANCRKRDERPNEGPQASVALDTLKADVEPPSPVLNPKKLKGDQLIEPTSPFMGLRRTPSNLSLVLNGSLEATEIPVSTQHVKRPSPLNFPESASESGHPPSLDLDNTEADNNCRLHF